MGRWGGCLAGEGLTPSCLGNTPHFCGAMLQEFFRATTPGAAGIHAFSVVITPRTHPSASAAKGSAPSSHARTQRAPAPHAKHAAEEAEGAPAAPAAPADKSQNAASLGAAHATIARPDATCTASGGTVAADGDGARMEEVNSGGVIAALSSAGNLLASLGMGEEGVVVGQAAVAVEAGLVEEEREPMEVDAAGGRAVQGSGGERGRVLEGPVLFLTLQPCVVLFGAGVGRACLPQIMPVLSPESQSPVENLCRCMSTHAWQPGRGPTAARP